MDIDSLMYEINTKDVYNDISSDIKENFDASNYPEVHSSGIETGANKKVLGVRKEWTKTWYFWT